MNEIVDIASDHLAIDAEHRCRVLESQNRVLEVIARGSDLERTLSHLALVFEHLFEGALCSIHVTEAESDHLRLAAAPNMPDSYRAAYACIEMKARDSAPAAAIARRAPVVIEDVVNDPVWGVERKSALALGILSIWSQPILSQCGNALASVNFYFRERRVPDLGEIWTIDSLLPLGQLAIIHDRRARALQTADERLMSIAANLPGVVYQRAVKPNGEIRYTYISEGAEDLFGVPAAEIIADPNALFECHGPEYSKDFRDRLLAASRDLTLWDVEAPIITRQGEHKWTHAIARPKREPDGTVLWSGIILDATRIKQANLELSAANRAKSEFLANMSHELRTPLNAVIGFSEIMCKETFGKLGDEKYITYAHDIHESGTHLLQIINDILDLSKIEAGEVSLSETRVDVRRIIENSLQLVRDKADEQKIDLSYSVAPDIRLLRADERKIKQILINLLSNAVKFTTGGGSVKVEAVIEEDGRLALSVIDSGIGIAPEHHHLILQPFAQVDGGLNRKFEGTGLGLPLCKVMAELHGANLDLQSALGKGTTVTVRFPAERVLPLESKADVNMHGQCTPFPASTRYIR